MEKEKISVSDICAFERALAENQVSNSNKEKLQKVSVHGKEKPSLSFSNLTGC